LIEQKWTEVPTAFTKHGSSGEALSVLPAEGRLRDFRDSSRKPSDQIKALSDVRACRHKSYVCRKSAGNQPSL